VGRRGREQHEIPLAPIERIIHQEGGYRVSEEAALKLRSIVERMAREIARVSVQMAQHAQRRTVRAKDVEMALRIVLSKPQSLLEEGSA